MGEMKNYPQQPHGGKLVNRVLEGEAKQQAIEKSKQLPTIVIDLEAIITVEMIATGVLSPNEGFMSEEDYLAVLKTGRLANGVVWPVPLSFAPTGKLNQEVIQTLAVGDEVVLADYYLNPIAILTVNDIFDYDKEMRAQELFNTTDRHHPGVDSIFRRMGDVSLGGTIDLIQRVDWGPFEKMRMEPKDTWRYFYEEKGYKTVGGFITGANPLHRGHEYIHKNALETLDAVLIQPLVELAKREYTRHEYRMLAYRAVVESYYPKERALLSPLRVTYIFAGPRETILHALIMKNYGATHALIGRDHAGVGDFYDKYESHSIFDQFTPEELGIEVRLFHEVFYCTRCANLASEQTCPHSDRYRINISGTGIRELLRHGIMPPKEIVRPESARIAMQGVQPKGVDSDGESITPVGKTLNSIFPYYKKTRGIGRGDFGREWNIPEFTIDDLHQAIMDVRMHADTIYRDVFDEFSYVTDISRNVQPTWRTEARETLFVHQQMVVDDLRQKAELAEEKVADEFMYQPRHEAERELHVAEQILSELSQPIDVKKVRSRIWNPMPYHRYRGDDEE